MLSGSRATSSAGASEPTNWDDVFPVLDKLRAAGLIPLAFGGQKVWERNLFNAVLVGKGLRRWDEGTLTPWLFGKLQALWDWRAILRHRRELGGDESAAAVQAWGMEDTFWGLEDTSMSKS